MLRSLILGRIRDSYSAIMNRKGDRLWRKGELNRAEQAFRRSLRANGSNAAACSNLGNVLFELHRYEEAFALVEAAARLDPSDPGILVNLGNAYYRSGRINLAVDAYQSALEQDSANISGLASLVRPLMELCAWSALDKHLERVREARDANGRSLWTRSISPFNSLFLPMTRQEQQLIAKQASSEWIDAMGKHRREVDRTKIRKNSRLRVAYLSSDFRNHAIGHLTLGVYAAHDRDQFEIYAYSTGYPDGSHYHQQIASSCDCFVDVHDWSASQIAQRIRDNNIDILVDLNGYSGGSRPSLLAMRPAPIQVNYLGYPGTMGAEFIDFIIADQAIIPEDHSADYSERIIRMPDSYQATDDRQAIDDAPASRLAEGLPATGVVFCCFNTPAKIDSRTFACWTRILSQVPGSVLWLLQTSSETQANLANAAVAAGIAPERLVYSRSLPKPKHLSRLGLADLVLDTFIYNAHTTTTDALWAGVPVVTLTGETFASRVATSLLCAAGLSDLVTSNENDYVALAVRLATDKACLGHIRQRLRERQSDRLFNTRRYVGNLEAAFREMYDLRQR